MSDYVLLSPLGFIPYDRDNEINSETENTEGTILRQLRCACEIAPNTTLLDIFNGLDQDPVLRGLIGMYTWNSHIKGFHEQSRLPRLAENPDENELISLIISFRVNIRSEPDSRGVQCDSDLSAMSSDGTRYSISCSPMNSVAHLPVLLEKAEVYMDHKLIGSYPYCYSLLEVLDAIYFDIGFYGGPSENDALREELKVAVDEINSGRGSFEEYHSRGMEIDGGDPLDGSIANNC
jgi:hypothetical protein